MHTHYSTQALPHPRVVVMTREELTQEYYSGVANRAPGAGVDERLKALYAFEDGPHGTIYILSSTAVNSANRFANPTENPRFREILLHELVHHVQWHSQSIEQWQCSNQGELEAYLLGAMYLKQQNTHDPMINRILWANRYSRC